MGTLNVKLLSSQKDIDANTRYLLRDLKALEYMLDHNWFNESPIHLGAEQEMCLVDRHCKPNPISLPVLEKLNDQSFTTEIAKFNLELNLDPLEFKGKCFGQLEQNIYEKLDLLQKWEQELGFDVVITGILPTLRKTDLEMDNLTPLPRYSALIRAIKKMRGNAYELRIRGMDELNVKHDSALLEACNTSFQVHLQVAPDDFAKKYNIALAVTAPVLALASNSPYLFGKRLWSETRIALFQQSVDTRRVAEHFRDRSPRVTFGNDWLRGSVIDLYREDIVRYRPMLMTQQADDVMDLIDQGIAPKLSSLMTHNSTVYRWNRACYGISPNGKPHLRIENRVLPAGPSVIDEVANAAFWLGLVEGYAQQYEDITQMMSFDDARSNFVNAAFSGLDTDLSWFNRQKIGVKELVRDELLSVARRGLEYRKVAPEDIDKYLEVIAERNETGRNGSFWVLSSYNRLNSEVMNDEVSSTLTSSMIRHQQSKKPVHLWEIANRHDSREWSAGSLLVEEFMTRDVFTVEKDDIPELVANIMDWKKIRFMPVEDKKGKLVGLISARMLLRYLLDKHDNQKHVPKTVSELMIKDPLTISPDRTVAEAMRIMKVNKVACLPVVQNNNLVGIISEGNFLNVTASLLNVLDNQTIHEQDNRKD
jgi:CBS domain-containing protein/gamma-glutamylcysteine synthetase